MTIDNFAGILKENQEEYNSRFSAILKNGLIPEEYPSHFQEIKDKLFGGKLEEKPAPKNDEKNEKATALAPRVKKKDAPAKQEKKKAPKEKKEIKKKESKEKKKVKGGKSKKK